MRWRKWNLLKGAATLTYCGEYLAAGPTASYCWFASRSQNYLHLMERHSSRLPALHQKAQENTAGAWFWPQIILHIQGSIAASIQIQFPHISCYLQGIGKSFDDDTITLPKYECTWFRVAPDIRCQSPLGCIWYHWNLFREFSFVGPKICSVWPTIILHEANPISMHSATLHYP